jgi:hypothetical protein
MKKMILEHEIKKKKMEHEMKELKTIKLNCLNRTVIVVRGELGKF